ncbi:DUF418 domain-containing protein [Aurantiacibacter sp. MUD61]|uniref:DUF418 domain-containing protein n=1 Tax=Aurantiacibacter sp. MUD61 TaxID=3009083 RepID=UPI0022F0B565|nr:DUF418 domain-containing protein [Aurantiacibacter sp. MUD61]
MTEQATPDGEPAAIAPTTGAERLASLDLIRGIAVLGILAANIVFFGHPQMAYMWPDGFVSDAGDPDRWMWIAQFVLIDGKMRGLFTLLFGAGIILFMEKAWERGGDEMLLVRRMAFLLLFGLIHYFFIWRGDILTLYAMAGMVGLIFLRMKGKGLIILGVLAYVIGGLIYAFLNAVPHLMMQVDTANNPMMADAIAQMNGEKERILGDDAAETAILTTGNYVDFVRHNFAEHLTEPFSNGILLLIFETVPLMLIGMGLYKVGLFEGKLNPTKTAIWGWIGVISGSAVTLLIAIAIARDGITFWESVAAFSSYSVHPRLPVIIGLISLLALYGANAKGWLAERLSAAGRAAFTNYLGTSVLMMLIFHPWAGGLWGELSRPELYLVVALGWAVMLGWSKPWLEKYRYGPLEWLWRCLTYGKRFPLKR